MIDGNDPQINIQFIIDSRKKRTHNFRRHFFHIFVFEHTIPHPDYAAEIILCMTDAAFEFRNLGIDKK